MKIGLAEEMRSMDKAAIEQYGIPDSLLMENAGHAVALETVNVLGNVKGKIVSIIAGSGNNGGDALCTARHLEGFGATVKIFLLGNTEHMKPAAAIQWEISNKMGLEITILKDDRDWKKLQLTLKLSDLVVDGLLGTGFTGTLREETSRLIEFMNGCNLPILSIDIPSGVNSDTGAVESVAVKANATVGLALPKPGHYVSPGKMYTGKLIIDSIGMPSVLLTADSIRQQLLEKELVRNSIQPRSMDAHKGNCGRILVIAGSIGLTGAAAMASQAVLRAGAGIATLAIPDSLHDLMEVKLTEVMTVPVSEIEPGVIGMNALSELVKLSKGYDAVLIGPGLGRHEETMELVRKLITEISCPVILDADAIFAFTGEKEKLSECMHTPILTPHLGEMARLVGVQIPVLRSHLVSIARDTARACNAIFVVKSECTIIAYPDGRVFFNSIGNPGMATAGSGDVLAGTIAGLTRQVETEKAPLVGTYLHSLAGDLAAKEYGNGLIATDIIAMLPKARMEMVD